MIPDNYRFEILEGHIVRTIHILPDGDTQTWDIYLENVFWGGKIEFPMDVEPEVRNKILWMHEMTEEEFEKTGEYNAKGASTGVLCIYCNDKVREMNFLMLSNMTQMRECFLSFKHRNAKAYLRNGKFHLKFEWAVFAAKLESFSIDSARVIVDKNHSVDIDVSNLQTRQFRKVKISIPLESIAEQETNINNPIRMEIMSEGDKLTFHIGNRQKKSLPSKFYYVPISSAFYRDKAFYVRKNDHQHYTLMVRNKEEAEYDRNIMKYEGKCISWLMYHAGAWKKKHRDEQINLYYEKNAFKAEEGTFEVFLKACKFGTSQNYYIIDKNSPDWERVKDVPGVVPKFSKMHYWLIYTADNLIASETASHMTIFRSTNKYIRKAILEKKFIFLQHGVTYLKRQGRTSAFLKGREGEPDYIVVDSMKEANIVAKMLEIPIKRCIIAGLPIFSTLEYNHINEDSDDIVTIMLTWKPSEEHMMDDFEKTSYYKNVCRIYEIMKERVPKEKIQIVLHPKIAENMGECDLLKAVWKGTIAEALRRTKLLITDYSSVCYNSFYQGAGVIFYQPDCKKYEKEVGTLIPKENEYIGYRTKKEEELIAYLDEGIEDSKILLKVFRNEEYVARYKTINEFTDGNNIERLVTFLHMKELV